MSLAATAPASAFEASSLDPYQTAAWNAIEKGEHVCIQGPAGTGKSHLTNSLRIRCPERTAFTGTTGIAGLNIGGVTLNSFLRLGLATDTPERIASRIEKTPSFRTINSIERLALDEMSMADAHLGNLADRVCRIVRGAPDLPFGGLQVCMFGDFLQLPPVNSHTMLFESEAWEALDPKIINLQQIHRQSEEEYAFIEALSHFREGRTPQSAVNLMLEREGAAPEFGEPEPIELHAKNVNVDRINDWKLAKVHGSAVKYNAKDSGRRPHVDNLAKYCLAPAELRLKVGARVMLLRNVNVKAGLANGSLGTVKQMTREGVTVRFDNGVTTLIGPEKWEIEENGTVMASRQQIPLRLAYAITIHKSQGLTFDSLKCDLAGCFDYGHVYVALSRARALRKLYLKNFDPRAIKAHPAAVEFLRKAA